VVCHVAAASGEVPLGFLPDNARLVTVQPEGSGRTTLIRVRNALSGTEQKRLAGPYLPKTRVGLGGLIHSFVVPYDLGVIFPTVSAGRWILDVETGRRIDPPRFSLAGFSFNPRRSWAVFTGYPTGPELRAFDLTSGRILFTWPPPARAGADILVGTPIFLGDDRIAVSMMKRGSQGSGRLEIYDFANPSEPVQVVERLILIENPSATNEGRILWHETDALELVNHVYDLKERREIFVFPDQSQKSQWDAHTISIDYPPSRLSADGRTLLDRARSVLVDLDTGHRLWSGNQAWGLPNPTNCFRWARQEWALDVNSSESFEVAERWGVAVGRWTKNAETYAVRRIRDGSLVYRSWRETLGRNQTSNDGTLLVDVDWNIRSLPPRVNYPLLALCQTILAMPLVLTWLAFRWQRKRWLRLASMAP